MHGQPSVKILLLGFPEIATECVWVAPLVAICLCLYVDVLVQCAVGCVLQSPA